MSNILLVYIFLCLVYNKKMIRKKFKNDILLIIILLVGCLIGSAFFLLSFKSGSNVIVKQNGKEVSCYPLSNDFSTNIESANGTNTLVIKDGKAFIENATCPDKICEKHRAISKSGETIVCLPHRLVIEIE